MSEERKFSIIKKWDDDFYIAVEEDNKGVITLKKIFTASGRKKSDSNGRIEHVYITMTEKGLHDMARFLTEASAICKKLKETPSNIPEQEDRKIDLDLK